MSEKRVLFFFADYWDEMWRRRQQLAWRLAQTDLVGHVVYIERPLPITSFLKFLAGRVDRDGSNRWRRILCNRSWVMPVRKNLSVLTTFAPLPLVKSVLLFQISERVRDRWLLFRLRERFNVERPLVWVSHPQLSVEVVNALKPRLLWYDCTEDFSAYPGLPECVRAQIRRTDQWLTAHADVITTVSTILYEEKRRYNANTYWLPNAVDFEIFQEPQGGFPVPLDLQGRAHPILAFVGGLGEWAHNWELLDTVATRRPDWTILLIGEVCVNQGTWRMLRGHPNILLVGQKPYQALPAYLSHADVCFQFYRQERRNDSGNSQKLFLYIAAGKPVVSTPSADVNTYKDFVYIVNSPTEFVQNVENTLSKIGKRSLVECQAFAQENSWDSRIKTIIHILQQYVS